MLESAYEAALAYELKLAGLSVNSQVGLPMVYETIKVDVGYRMDLVVEGKSL